MQKYIFSENSISYLLKGINILAPKKSKGQKKSYCKKVSFLSFAS